MDFQNGTVLLVNKPIRWTSFDVVKKIKNITGAKKVGHAGTLDPLATGLMILCTGKMTKQLDNFQAEEKEYSGSFFIGESTPSYDRELPPDAFFPTTHITNDLINSVTAKFRGIIEQFPPPYSAVKINGKRAYEMARKGKEVAVKVRNVEIKEFEIIKIEFPLVFFRIVCSKGTYIRSIANDFGKYLGSGACLESLCRTRIGEYKIENAFSIDEIKDRINSTSSN